MSSQNFESKSPKGQSLGQGNGQRRPHVEEGAPNNFESMADIGFHIRLKPTRGISAEESDVFEMRLQDYLKRHELDWEGGPLLAWITCSEREMTHEDCMDFLTWVAQDGAIAHMAASNIMEHQSVAALELDPAEFSISISVDDPCLQAVRTLYRAHRLSARQALAALDVAAPFQATARPQSGS